MAIRIKSQWHKDKADREPKEIGEALAYIAWRIALDRAISLHGENFVYQNDQQRMLVVAEYLFYQCQIIDRLTHHKSAAETRAELITAMALKLSEHYQDNCADLLGQGDHAAQFIDRFNQRSTEYAELSFSEAGPGYPFLRHLGFEVQQIMGCTEQNRWVIDQVMDSDGPEIYQQLLRAYNDLLR